MSALLPGLLLLAGLADAAPDCAAVLGRVAAARQATVEMLGQIDAQRRTVEEMQGSLDAAGRASLDAFLSGERRRLRAVLEGLDAVACPSP